MGEESGVENGTKETRGCQGDPRSQLPEVATGGRHRAMKTTRELPWGNGADDINQLKVSTCGDKSFKLIDIVEYLAHTYTEIIGQKKQR